jgi:hypothetical protein
MKNRMQLYGKCMAPVVIVGIMLCFASAVWAATDVYIGIFDVVNKSRGCSITKPEPSGCDIYDRDIVQIKGVTMICGCHNRTVQVKFEADAQLLWEGLMYSQLYPSEPVCYKSTVCPVGFSYGKSAQWTASPGTHTLKFTVDSKNEIHELNENNNSKSVTVTVKLRQLKLPETKPKTPINIPVPTSPAGGQLR